MPEPAALDLFFCGVPGAVRILSGRQPAAVTAAVLRRVLGGWPHDCRPAAPDTATDAAPPRFLVEARDDGSFHLHGASPEATDFTPFLPGDPAARLRPGYSCEPTLTCLATTLAIELVAVYEAQSPQHMGLHAAAAARDGLTLLFCGSHRAGKSLLMARLLLAGWQGLGDDMLGLSPEGELFSYGLAPRLRLPLPPCPGLARLLAPQSPLVACRDDRYLCCDPLSLPQLPWGTRRPLAAIMVLDRQEEHAPRPGGIFVQPRAQDLREVLRRFLLRDGRAGLALRTVDRLLQVVPCRLLRYTDPDEALRLLTAWTDARLQGLPPEDVPLSDAILPDVILPVTPLPTASRDGEQPPRDASPETHAAPAGDGPRPRAFRRRLAARSADARPTPPSAARQIRYRQRPGVIFRQDESGAFLARDEDCPGRDGKIFLLNRMGCVLWQLWQEPGSDAELADLLREAFPQTPAGRILRDVVALRRRLCAAGLLLAAD